MLRGSPCSTHAPAKGISALALTPAGLNFISVVRACLKSVFTLFLLGELVLPLSSRAAQFLNISTRGFVGPGDDALIGGFILSGAGMKRVLIRGIGPSLTNAGLSDVLSDPTLELRDPNGVVIFANDDWQETQKSEIEQTTLAPSNDKEAALLWVVRGEGNYTVLLRGASEGTGIGLIEIYDLSPNVGSLANVSTRGRVETGDRAMIGGVIIGAGNLAEQIMVRGIGPSLAAAGIDDNLADPTLDLRSSSNALLAANNDWKTSQQSLIEQTGIPPERDLESAIVSDLSPGSYTAILRGGGNGVGVGVVEFYQLESPGTPLATFSFENGLEGWTPKATDINDPPIAWSIQSSPERASDGTHSAKFELENLNDAGKIWLGRPFSLQPNQSYHVKVQFSFATQDFGEANLFTIIAGVRTSPAVTRDDLTYQGFTGNGDANNTGYKWLEKSYDFNVVSAADGTVYVDIGIWGTWETYRAYYIDNLRISVTQN
jgi:hypothetical protein